MLPIADLGERETRTTHTHRRREGKMQDRLFVNEIGIACVRLGFGGLRGLALVWFWASASASASA